MIAIHCWIFGIISLLRCSTMTTPSDDQIEIWEKEYAPSKWTKRFDTPREVLDHHVKFVTEVSRDNRKQLCCTLNVRYGRGENATFDIYGDDLPGDAPLFVYIHGGYWQMLYKTDSAYCVKPLVERGYRVIILGYDLCPKINLEQLVAQIKSAGVYILNYAAEKHVKHISFAGHSAGAHLIATMLDCPFVAAMGKEIDRIKQIYLISGVYKLDELFYTTEVNKNNLLGLNALTIQSLSPLLQNYQHLLGFNSRIHIYVGENESPVFKQMSSDMCKHFEKFALDSTFQILPNLDHFNIVEKLSEKDYFITNNILEHFSGNQ
ncbi:kynurenine formamidase [Toxorhynchites rutilus septentrionalis]|uniref:kynurenine formamidase n=1 Tax=Toxorhynchites rutilus septentrionalis TaxID=329112 RepID=UPI002478AAE6|nr:kynurenine formamidase [Toxorhynchites rutilus septentrionalis]